MGIDFTKMYDGMKTRFNELKKANAEINAQDIAKNLFAYADGAMIKNLTSIFNQAAMSDGNNNLSEAEFEEAIASESFKQVVENHTKRMNEIVYKARDLENEPKPIDMDNPEVSSTPGTPRDSVVAEKGEWFANEIWDPMKNLANEALKYMQENNGTLEKFNFTGFPHGVRLMSVAPCTSFLNASNDTMTIVNGQPQVTRHADSMQAMVIFEFQGETYKLFSDEVAENLEPWGNPSYNEADIIEVGGWGAPAENVNASDKKTVEDSVKNKY